MGLTVNPKCVRKQHNPLSSGYKTEHGVGVFRGLRSHRRGLVGGKAGTFLIVITRLVVDVLVVEEKLLSSLTERVVAPPAISSDKTIGTCGFIRRPMLWII
ncbi:MAG: hypothetical protein ACXABY_03335 [Candidatus Thorarchaeota archaeon]|jgi:hypothetical protein